MTSGQNQAVSEYLSNRFDHKLLSSVREKKRQWLIENYSYLLPPDKNSFILEIGPGYGEMLEWLAKDSDYCNFFAIDISQEVVGLCNKIIPDKTIHVQNTAKFIESEAEDGKLLDLVFMIHVLEHIPKAEALDLLTQVKKSLSDRGCLIVEVPNMANPIVGTITRYDDFTHEVGYTSDSLTQVLRSAGFLNIEIRELLPPNNSFLRFVQRTLQALLNTAIKMLINIYFPGKNMAVAPSIYAIARKG